MMLSLDDILSLQVVIDSTAKGFDSRGTLAHDESSSFGVKPW